MKIIVIGAGAWGTALAVSAARNPAGHHVVLWARDGAQAQTMDSARENARYLPGIPLPRELTVRGSDVASLLEAAPPGAMHVGFYSYGEISPGAAGGASELHNQTMTVTVFREI